MQPSLSLSVGSREVAVKPFFWLRFSKMHFWPPEELPFSLAHVKALYHLSLLILAHTLCSPFSSVRSVFTGACKITWQEQLKALDRTDVPSVLQTFTNFCFIKIRVHWKEVVILLPKGQLLLSFLQSCKVIQYKFI